MTKTAVLVSGGGATLQALLDLCYFEELPGLEISAVISSVPGVYALERAANARVPAYVVERALFPNSASFSNALLGKLRDLDISLVVCAGCEAAGVRTVSAAISVSVTAAVGTVVSTAVSCRAGLPHADRHASRKIDRLIRKRCFMRVL